MKIGIIGGSGLEKSDLLQQTEEIEIETIYGKPSSAIKKAKFGEVEVYILSRHGPNHEIIPTNVNNQANISALSKLGCRHIIATTAVGSLKENIRPGDFVIANQFIDFTKHRKVSFFDDFKQGVKHVSLAEPFSQELRDYIIEACEELKMPHHKIGTILTIEGPRFSTRAESFMFKRFAHVVNMSTAPEAILAKEAEIEYAVIAMTTDFDCWKKTEEPVTWEQIEKIMKQNSENVKKVLVKAIEKFGLRDSLKKDKDYIKKSIRTVPHFPKQGVMFRDITTLLKDPQAMKKVMDILVNKYKDKGINIVTGIEARGFIFGSLLAEKIGASFVPVRKPGKLPAETEKQEYELEYGKDAVEIHKDAILPGNKVLVVDDLIATGGTAAATAELVERLGGKVEELAFVIELPDLKGREKLKKHNVYSIVSFEGG